MSGVTFCRGLKILARIMSVQVYDLQGYVASGVTIISGIRWGYWE